MPAPDGVVLEQVSKRYGTFRALDGVDLALPEGAFLLLAGPNGAGKSTLLRLLAGLGKPSGGSVRVAGADPYRDAAARRQIGLLSHQILLYEDLTARENLAFFARLYGLAGPDRLIAHALGRAGLAGRGDDRVRTFSRGMKQRLALARATLHEPTVVLFDEPFTGLDHAAAIALSQHLHVIRTQGRTCVLVTHRLETAAGLIDHLALVDRKSVV